MKINSTPLSAMNAVQLKLASDAEVKGNIRTKRDIPDGYSVTGPGNNRTIQFPRVDASKLKFTQDPRGKEYKPLEKQLAGSIIRKQEWHATESDFTASYGTAYDARESILSWGLAAADIHDTDNLPTDWYKDQQVIDNLKSRVQEQYSAPRQHPVYNARGNSLVPSLPVEAGRDFYNSQLGNGKEYKTNTWPVPGLETKPLGQYSDRDKVQALKYFSQQPLQQESNEASNSDRYMKAIGLLLAFDGLAADVGALGEIFAEGEIKSELEEEVAGNSRVKTSASRTSERPGQIAILPEYSGSEINRLRPSQSGNISQYALRDGETLIQQSRVGTNGIHQIKNGAGEDRWLLRYKDSTGESKVYEINQNFRTDSQQANIIDPATRKEVLNVSYNNGEWRQTRLPGGMYPGRPMNQAPGKTYPDPRQDLPQHPLDLSMTRQQEPVRPAPVDIEPRPGPSSETGRPVSESGRSSSRSSVSGSNAGSSGVAYSPYQDIEPPENPLRDSINLPQGSYLNNRGYIERNNFDTLYRVEKKERTERRGDPQDIGFRDSMHFGGVKKMTSGPSLIVSRSQKGAEEYGAAEFGWGEFHLYKINAQGIPGVSLNENIEHNENFMELSNSYPTGTIGDLRRQNRLREFGENAYNFDEVHLENKNLSNDRVVKMY
ncbi:hypothetical protein EHW65_04545 [Erwinia psidii]|uniref:hypothetical protein n=1 Tax=Erwinia psidii TaxID=69224 RepID=UPI00226B87E4|nr:hypothetical protein [Erwinia psidii]MCX8956574.1 hypothetical protein [Erwinia psidii]